MGLITNFHVFSETVIEVIFSDIYLCLNYKFAVSGRVDVSHCVTLVFYVEGSVYQVQVRCYTNFYGSTLVEHSACARSFFIYVIGENNDN